MSDRPDRPPVWVRGGQPYYYTPVRAQLRQDVPPTSLTSTTSMSPTSPILATSPTAGEPVSPRGSVSSGSPGTSPTMGSSALPGFPPAPPGAIEEYRRNPQRATGAPSQFPSGQSQSQGLTGSLPWPRFQSGEYGTSDSSGSSSEQRPGRRYRSRSFHGLTSQKRTSTDDMMRMRRESWREMGTKPPTGIWGMWGKWWDGYTKG